MNKILYRLLFFPMLFPAYSIADTQWQKAHSRLSFRYLSVNDGLSQYTVNAIVQEPNGRMMIATYDGLNWYDGYTIEARRHSVDEPDGLIQNRILFLRENADGNIWIGMDGGLMLYDVCSHKYTDHTHLLSNLTSKRVRAIYEDPDGRLWVGTDREVAKGYYGLSSGDPLSVVGGLESYEVYTIEADDKENIWIGTENGLFLCRTSGDNVVVSFMEQFQGQGVWSVHYDTDGILWVGSTKGLAASPDGETFQKVPYSENITHIVRSIRRAKDGRLWVGTQEHGLFGLSLDENLRVTHMDPYCRDDFFGHITDNDVGWIFIDRSNVLWIGTRRGVNYADLTPKNIHTFDPLIEHRLSELGYEGRHITTLHYDTFGTLWISVDNGKLFRYDPDGRKFLPLPGHLQKVSRMIQTSDNELWVLLYKGVYKLRITRERIMSVEEIDLPDVLPAGGRTSRVFVDICRDRYGDMWIATTKGLIRYFVVDKKSILYTRGYGLASNYAYSLLADPDHNVIWMGSSENGLTRIVYEENTTGIKTQIIRQDTPSYGLNSNQIWWFLRSCDGTIWIGTDAGPNRMETSEGEIVSICRVEAPYLKDAKILAITEDTNGDLWLNSSQSLYHYDPDSGNVNRYFSEDGLQSNTWTEAATISPDGWIFVGGINGINYFNPSLFKYNGYRGKPILISLSVNDEPVSVGENSILATDINMARHLTLTHDKNNLRITFASDHHAAPGKNRFRYRLSGYDKNWTEVDASQRYASYVHLPAGHYTFSLQSSNNDGLWSEDTKNLDITVTPPWWKTWWAVSIYAVLVLSVILTAISYAISRHRWRHRLLVQQLEQEKTRELSEMKLDFYTNITHELRTPLALIMAPLNDLSGRSEGDEYARFRLDIIRKNAGKLLLLINQILDVRRASGKEMPLVVSKHNLSYVVRDVAHSFACLSEQMGIILHLDIPEPLSEAWFDRDKIEKVLQNLLSNAYKFTPEQGNIHVGLRTEERDGIRFSIISVQDDGIGIPAGDLDKVFDIFYRGMPLNGYSSGVGLSMSKALIEAHGGTIAIESVEGKGSVFTIGFPVDPAFYPPEQKRSATPDTPESDQDMPLVSVGLSHLAEFKHLVLVVEDNEDMRAYIRESLRDHFRVETVSNGKEALSAAGRLKPDLIISDIMMPEMDGIELIRGLKANPRTNFIPIIVHSVKEDKKSIREALTLGAHEYIIKPFEPENLVFRISNLLRSRAQFAQKLKAEIITEPTRVEVPSSDEQLLKKIGEIVERNMESQLFDIELLAVELGMSRMHLYRRVKGIAGGKTVAEVIRDIRIKRAEQLLSTGQMRVNEVMVRVGFNSHYRFVRYFEEAYGMKPREYMQIHARQISQ